MSVLFIKLAGTTFFLFLFFVIITLMLIDKDKIYYTEWEDQPTYVKFLGFILGMLVISTITSITGSMIAKIWGY